MIESIHKRRLRLFAIALCGGLAAAGATVGCHDDSPPPARAAIPQRGDRPMLEGDPVKPLPPPRPMDQSMLPPPPFDDVPLVEQQTPEQPSFVKAYRDVGSPRIVLFVNRTLEGAIVPVNANDPIASVDRTRTARGDVRVETSARGSDRRYAQDSRQTIESHGNGGEIRDRTDVYLRPGQYDEVAAKSLDYEAVENVITDWISCNNQVTVISPTMARQRLSDEQVKELQSGRPQVLSEVAQQLDANILIQVQSHPTRQTERGLEVRIIAEAINIKGGESIGRAFVDVPPPLDKPQINTYTRFLARKLMAGMLGAWSAPPPPDHRRPDAGTAGGAPPAVPRPVPPAPGTAAPPPQPVPPAPSGTGGAGSVTPVPSMIVSQPPTSTDVLPPGPKPDEPLPRMNPATLPSR